MSNEPPQDRARGKKREAIQRPFRQGFQWLGRQLDELRSSSASPRPTRPQTAPQVNHYGPVYHIGTAGNVFSAPNFGSVTMISENEEIMVNLRSLLKVCVKADHMYYANSSETALRRCSCTPGTRVDILQGITLWAIDMSPTGERVYWLSGQAGAGKTTISYTVARLFETLFIHGKSRVMLGGTFFCSRQFEDTRSASAIIRTIVYHLALRSKAFRAALREHGRFETVDHGPRSQLMGLLVEPWRKCARERRAKKEPCYVVPTDALDELEGMGGVVFLSTLLDIVDQQDLSGLKFFVTTRSEPALVKRIESFSNKQVCRLEQVPLKESSADIKVYLNENLAECATAEQIEQLVLDADGLFIHAATVVEFVKGRDVREQKSLLERLLSTTCPSARRPTRGATATLDNLYLQILETSLVDPREGDDEELFQGCLSILHIFVCTIQRTSTSVAVAILNASGNRGNTVADDGIANGVLHRLYAVLYSHNSQVMWFHQSFPDFLFDKDRSGRFFCNQEQQHRHLADGCLNLMSKELRFNIADIPTSYQLDRDEPMLPVSIDNNISMPLRYACGNWSSHLILTSHKSSNFLAESLNDFLQLHILFWIETVVLLGHRGRCHRMLRDAQQWSQKAKTGPLAYFEVIQGYGWTPGEFASSLTLAGQKSEQRRFSKQGGGRNRHGHKTLNVAGEQWMVSVGIGNS
ncbi:hypothetical protein BKA70DRAFT_1411870 [Coprinopsis sp. MPI-PUGE-AT-0042]|nr:hypothetical protein BKA70DRAFT_1411870 [Coprinopsis sp. MPI-PUGE-AT-0042]